MQPAAPIIVAVIGGQVVGVSLDSGQVVWRYAMEGAIAPPRIHVTAHHVFVAGPVLACLDYRTGGVYWHVAAPKTHNNPGTMLVQDGRLLFGVKDTLFCHAISDGRLLWHCPLPAKGWEQIALGAPGNVAQADGR